MLNHTGKDKSESASHGTIVNINCALNAPMILISIVGNALVLAAIFKTPSIRSTSMTMLCSLAVSDLLVGLIAQPLYVADELKSLRTQDQLLYRLSAMIGFFVCGVSLATMTAISVDRFLALHYHMRYATLVTEFRVRFTVGMIWLIMFLWLGFYLWNKFVYHLMAGIFTAICIVICTFCYIRIYRIVWLHKLQIHTQQLAMESSIANAPNNDMRMARLTSSAINTFLFYLFMVMCYFPNFVLMTLFGTTYKAWKGEWTFATTVVFMNSAINPILYCWRLRELRKAVTKIAKQVFLKQMDEN